jgi:c(7)-type cytochrome triheme protein
MRKAGVGWLGAAWLGSVATVMVFLIIVAAPDRKAQAEYGDVVINNLSDDAGMRPVIFSHWFHRIRYRCKVCHGDLGIEFKAGGNQINMLQIIEGEYCGACHNGVIAWGVENCDLCHTAKPSTPTHVHGSTLKRLVAPPSVPVQ